MNEVTSVLSPSNATTPDGDRLSFGQMKKDIAAFFGMDGDSEKEALAGRCVHDIIDELNMKRLWQFNLVKAADFSTVAGTSLYSMATVAPDLWRVYNLRKSDGIDYMLDAASQFRKDLLFQSQNGLTGFPFIRTDFNIYRDGSFEVFPTPQGVHTMTLRYFRLIPKPYGDGQFLDMPSPYQVVPKHGAMAQFASLVGSDQVGYWQGKYESTMKDMQMMDEEQPGDDEIPRFINIEEIAARDSYINPAARPRYLDWY